MLIFRVFFRGIKIERVPVFSFPRKDEGIKSTAKDSAAKDSAAAKATTKAEAKGSKDGGKDTAKGAAKAAAAAKEAPVTKMILPNLQELQKPMTITAYEMVR